MKQQKYIEIKGARTHNLKNINIKFPINEITCISGPSGSGKTSLAFHTLLTESKRRFINSLPNDVKLFWDIPHQVEVDSIYPVLPVWGLAQHNPILGARPNVLDTLGMTNEISQLFFLLGGGACPEHGEKYISHSPLDIFHMELKKAKDEKMIRIFIKRDHFLRYYPNGPFPSYSSNDLKEINQLEEEDKFWEVTKISLKNIKKFETFLQESPLKEEAVSFYCLLPNSKKYFIYRNAEDKTCGHCGKVEKIKVKSVADLSPLNPVGACVSCKGYGTSLEYDPKKLVKNSTLSIKDGAVNFLNFSRFRPLYGVFVKECKKNGFDIDAPFGDLPQSKIWKFLYEGKGNYQGLYSFFEYLETKKYKKNIRIYVRSMQKEVECNECSNTRVKKELSKFLIQTKSEKIYYSEFLSMSIEEVASIIEKFVKTYDDKNIYKILVRIIDKLESAKNLGLGHLNLKRKTKTLSASEYQRLLLVKYLSFKGSGSLFILDEPSLGLNIKEQKKVHKGLVNLKKLGNTIIIVDHSKFFHKKSDFLVNMGPGAGKFGGKIIYQGAYNGLGSEKKYTKEKIDLALEGKSQKWLSVQDAYTYELKPKSFKIPLYKVTWVSGEPGAGKNTIISKMLVEYINSKIKGEKPSVEFGQIKRIKIDDSPKECIYFGPDLGRVTSRSTIGTTIGLTAILRKYYARLKISKNLNLKDGHFSPNSILGMCKECEGKGIKSIDMHFLEDIEFVCENCHGNKLEPFYGSISDGNFSFNEVVSLPMNEVLESIPLTPKMKRLWEYIKLLNLDYLSLNRTLQSLSGGEKQRFKLLSCLQKDIKDSFLVFENISVGLSELELAKTCHFLNNLSKSNNTIIVIDPHEIFATYSHYSLQFQVDRVIESQKVN